MTAYETIFVRRSVRRYDKKALNEGDLADIRQFLDNAKQLTGQSARFEIVNADKLRGCAAPHAILAFAGAGAAAALNIGYALQGLDLYAQSRGLGSLWMGMAKPVEKREDYRCLLAFGKTDAPFRAGEQDFKRKSVLEISNEDNAVARAARLAPSAANFQPWKLDFSSGKVTVRYNGQGIGKLLVGSLQMIDLGIVLKYVELALEHEGKKAAITARGRGKSFAVEAAYT